MEKRLLTLILMLITMGTLWSQPVSVGDSLAALGEYKSPAKAMLMSMVLPGWGEYYVGRKQAAYTFWGLEAAFLAAWYGQVRYVETLRQDYQSFAALHAGASPDGKDTRYWKAIGKYDDIYAYNEQRARERNFYDMYPESEKYFWQWDQRSNRYTYDQKRLDANNIESYEVYFQLAVFLNHFISGINALRLARGYNKQRTKNQAWHFRLESNPPGSKTHYFGFRLLRVF